MSIRDTTTPRLCPRCGNEWERLTPHTCPHPVAEDPEALCALLWDVLTDVPVMIGDLSINVQVASAIVRPLGRELILRLDELFNALESDTGRIVGYE